MSIIVCNVCSLENSAGRNFCEVCQARLPSADSKRNSQSSDHAGDFKGEDKPGNMGAQKNKPGGMLPCSLSACSTVFCLKCSFENPAGRTVCSVCSSPLSVNGHKSVVRRECVACTFADSTPMERKCRMCDTELPEIKEIKESSAVASAVADQIRIAQAALDEARQTLDMLVAAELENVETGEEKARRIQREEEESAGLLAALQLENAQRAERQAQESSIEGVKGIHKCPHCQIPLTILPGEENCRIFICGVRRTFAHGASSQMPQHDEAAARREKEGGSLIGCAGQFQLTSEGKLESCSGR